MLLCYALLDMGLRAAYRLVLWRVALGGMNYVPHKAKMSDLERALPNFHQLNMMNENDTLVNKHLAVITMH